SAKSRGCASYPPKSAGCSSRITPASRISLTLSSASLPSPSVSSAVAASRPASSETRRTTSCVMNAPFLVSRPWKPVSVPCQEGQDGAFPRVLLLDHHPVPAVGEDVQFCAGDRAHRQDRHVDGADPVVAAPGEQGRRGELVQHRPVRRGTG